MHKAFNLQTTSTAQGLGSHSASSWICSSAGFSLSLSQCLSSPAPPLSGTSPCHSPGGGDLCADRLTPLGTFQADVSRGLCSCLTFSGILCQCAGPGENNCVHMASRTVTEVLGLSQRCCDYHIVLDCHIVLGASHICCDCHIVLDCHIITLAAVRKTHLHQQATLKGCLVWW